MPRARRRCGRQVDGRPCDQIMPCPTHRWRHTESATARGYGPEHQAERASWVPLVEQGLIHCRRGAKCRRYPDTLIPPGTPWHLGHPDKECFDPTAPEHVGCNTSAPGRLRNTPPAKGA